MRKLNELLASDLSIHLNAFHSTHATKIENPIIDTQHIRFKTQYNLIIIINQYSMDGTEFSYRMHEPAIRHNESIENISNN